MKSDDTEPSRRRYFRSLDAQKTKLKRQARHVEHATVRHTRRFVTNRLTRIHGVARHVRSWLMLVGLLIGLAFSQSVWFSDAYTTVAPVAGGTYAEGMIGQLEIINPLFASTTAEISASKLIFSSLLDYDNNNVLRPSVAESWSVSSDGKVYSVVLRKDVRWHDDELLTVDDIIFTIKLIQNEGVRAVQYGSWAGVKVERRSDTEVTFTLPNVYAPFAHALTFGILPKHLLEYTAPVDMRESEFGRHPIGSGPFIFKRIQLSDAQRGRLIVHMDANSAYFKGAPMLSRFQLHTYEDYDALQNAFRTQEINAALGLRAEQIGATEMAGNGRETPTVRIENGMYALFNTDRPLTSDASLRRALVIGTNREAIIESIAGRGSLLQGPFPDGRVPGSATLRQAPFDQKTAQAKLDELGWKVDGEFRRKDTVELALSLVAPDSGDYRTFVNELVEQWRSLGVKVTVEFADATKIASAYVQSRNYDVLIYELAIGADPDVYAYWHSSQAKATGLNFANYRSNLADDLLSSARARLDPDLRFAKYKAFISRWLADAPAVALYQPQVSYVTNVHVASLQDGSSVVDLATRYRNVQYWSVLEARVMRTP